MASDVFESYSAGTYAVEVINSDAVRLLKQYYGIDISKTQYSKLLSKIPSVDIVITMDCQVSCPSLPCRYREDWGLDDPTGKSEEYFVETIKTIEKKIYELKNRIKNGLV